MLHYNKGGNTKCERATECSYGLHYTLTVHEVQYSYFTKKYKNKQRYKEDWKSVLKNDYCYFTMFM